MFLKRGSNDTIRDMTKPLNYHIIIDRKDLPEVLITINTNGTYVHPAASSNMWTISKESSNTVRRRAMEYLAVAERIDGYLAAAKAKEAERAKADDEQKLTKEAELLREKFYGSLSSSQLWDFAPDKAYWTRIARVARELHGK